ncbi:hypothetical protein CR513_62398, partial [Mucuna pruriens]
MIISSRKRFCSFRSPVRSGSTSVTKMQFFFFTFKLQSDAKEIRFMLHPPIKEGYNALLALVSMDEVRRIYISMKSSKALGPYVFQPSFSSKTRQLLEGTFGISSISLCKVIDKVISKVFVSELRPWLDSLIGPFHRSFIFGHNNFSTVQGFETRKLVLSILVCPLHGEFSFMF